MSIIDGKFIKPGTIPPSALTISPDYVLENRGGIASFITTNDLTHSISAGDYSSILGGRANTITSSGNYILLIGGYNNLIESNANQDALGSFIISGGGSTTNLQNHIIGSTVSAILGGNSNKLGTTLSSGNSNNFIINSLSSTIGSGSNLITILSSVDISVADDVDYAVAVGLQGAYTMTQNDTVYMPKVRIGLGIGGELTEDNANTNALVLNAVTGEIEINTTLSSGGPVAAEDVSYDNVSSGLVATDVQEAIDELDTRLDASTSGSSGPVDTDDLAEGINNLYYTDTRVSANIDVAANTLKISASGSINTHSDVDTLTSIPELYDIMAWNGVNWVPDSALGTNGISQQLQETFIRWDPTWSPGLYEENTMTRDGGWTMIANTNTMDRAAPQEVGDPEWGYGESGTSGISWTTNQAAGFVLSGNEFTFTVGGWIQGWRVYIPVKSVDYEYIAFLKKIIEDGEDVFLGTQILPINTDEGWFTFAISPTIVLQTEKIEIGLYAENHANSSIVVDSDWIYTGQSNGNNPVSGAWNHTNNQTTLRIHTIDSSSTDQSSSLAALGIGDTITITQAASTWTYSLESVGTLSSSVYSWTVIRVIANGTIARDFECNIVGEDTDTVTTDYVIDSGYWSGNEPTWATVEGVLEVIGSPVTVSTNGFGADLVFQPGNSSEDWDFVAFTDLNLEITSVSGRAADTQIPYDNSVSNLAAVDVQGAIDELDERIDDLESGTNGNLESVKTFNSRSPVNGNIDPAQSDYLYYHVGAEAITTGLLEGGLVTLNIDPTQVDVTAGLGYIINTSDYFNPQYVKLEWTAETLSLITPALGTTTYIYVDAFNVIQTNTTAPTITEFKQRIYLSKVSTNNSEADKISDMFNPIGTISNNVIELMNLATGVLSGGDIILTATNTFGINEFEAFLPSINFRNDPLNPNKKTIPTTNPVTFRYMTRDGSVISENNTEVDPMFFNPSGNTIQQLPEDNNACTIQYLYLLPDATFTMLYGQVQYSSASSGAEKIYSDRAVLVVPEILQNALQMYAFVLEEDTDDLTYTGDAVIFRLDNTSDAGQVSPVLSVYERTGEVLAESGDYSADLITYDNGVSNLVATDVQGAIDELAGTNGIGGFAISTINEFNDYRLLFNPSSTDGYQFKTLELTLTNAEILTLGTSPIELIPASTLDFIVPVKGIFTTIGRNFYTNETLELIFEGDSEGSFIFKTALAAGRPGKRRMTFMHENQDNPGVYADAGLLLRAKDGIDPAGRGNGGVLKLLYAIVD